MILVSSSSKRLPNLFGVYSISITICKYVSVCGKIFIYMVCVVESESISGSEVVPTS